MTRRSTVVALAGLALLLTATVVGGVTVPTASTSSPALGEEDDSTSATNETSNGTDETDGESEAEERDGWERSVASAADDSLADGGFGGMLRFIFDMLLDLFAGDDAPDGAPPTESGEPPETTVPGSTTTAGEQPPTTTESPPTERQTTRRTTTTEAPSETTTSSTPTATTTAENPPTTAEASTTTTETSTTTTETPATTADTSTTTTETPTTTTTTVPPTTTESPEPPESGDLNWSEVERLVHEYVNRERAERGLGSLDFDTELRDIARSHSEDMATRDYVSHTSPEGETFADRYEQFGYDCRASTGNGGYLTGGENIAQTWYDAPVQTGDGTVRYTTEKALARGIVDQWMNSTGHRDNILNEAWQNEGIGIYVTDDGKVYVTQNFC